MESVYRLCFYGGLSLCIIFTILAVLMFFLLKIPKAIGDLTGRTERKTIKEMSENKPETGKLSKKEQAKYYNQGSGIIKVRETVSPEVRKANGDNTTSLLGIKEAVSEELGKEKNKNMDAPEAEPETAILTSDGEIIGTNVEQEESTDKVTSNVGDDSETDVLTSDIDSDEATDILTSDAGDDSETDVLTSDIDSDEATDILTSDAGDDNETDILTSDAGDDNETDILTSDIDSDEATDVLTSNVGDDDVTDILRSDNDDATDVLRGDSDEMATDILRGDEDGTSVLASSASMELARKTRVLYNFVVVHTEETL